jgi:hypothetical protein
MSRVYEYTQIPLRPTGALRCASCVLSSSYRSAHRGPVPSSAADLRSVRVASRPLGLRVPIPANWDSGRTGVRTNTSHSPITKKGPAFGQTPFSVLARPERFELPASASGDRSISEEPRAVRVV